MTRTHRIDALVLVAIFCCSAPAVAEEPPRGEVRLDGDVELQANGDGYARVLIDFAPADYTSVKAQNPNAHRFLRDFSSRRSNHEIREDAVARYNDARSAVILELTEEGALFNRGAGRWQLRIERGADFVNLSPGPDGRSTAFFYETGSWPGGITYRGKVRYHMPAGAADIAWDAGERMLRYTLARTEGDGPARLALNLQARKRLMTAIYKVYGLGTDFSAQWVAKGVLKNEGVSVLRDLRVRYRLEGYSEWSLWQKFPEMVPGQTIVCNYYPVLDESIARLSSNTPANLHVEWRFTDAAGQVHSDSDGRRLVLLGAHEFIFSNMLAGESFGTWHESTNNAPFIAAWVSRDDMVVKQFASLASHEAGGVGSRRSNEATVKVLKAIYELMVSRDFCYQHPPALLDRSVRFDVQSVQNVKFPRDVLRDRCGTCIDLAILYAAMGNALGIESLLAFIPGHAFPVFRVPGGGLVAVEATGVRGGLQENASVSFEKAFELGNEELEQWMRDGRIHLLDLQELWTRGISNPELPELPADTLQTLGLDRPARPDQGAVGPIGPVDPVTPLPDFSGTWSGQINSMLPGGQWISYPSSLSLRPLGGGRYAATGKARARIPDGYGYMVDVEVLASGEARVQSGGLTLTFQTKMMTYLATGMRVRMLPDQGAFSLQGGRLVGRVGNPTDGWVQIDFARG